MRAQVKRSELLEKLESVSPGLSEREIIEQSSCFVFKNGKIVTFDDEIFCAVDSPLDIEGAVPARPLLSLLHKLNSKLLTVTVEDSEFRVSGAKTSRQESGLRLQQEIFLPFDTITIPKRWARLKPFEHGELETAIEVVRHCTSGDATQFILCCVHLTPKYIEACDNSQLIRYNIEAGFKRSILVRNTSIRHVVSVAPTHYAVDDTWVFFRNAERNLVFASRRSMDEFPNFGKFLKVEGEKMKLPTGIKSAAERAEIFSAENPEANHLKVTLTSKGLSLEGRGDSGWHRETQPKVDYKGEDLSFIINPKVLQDVVERTDVSRCTISSNRLRVETEHYKYVTRLGRVVDANANGRVKLKRKPKKKPKKRTRKAARSG